MALKFSADTDQSFVEYIVPRWHIDAHLNVDVPTAREKGLQYWFDLKTDWLFEEHNPWLMYTGGTDSHTILANAHKRGHRFENIYTQLGYITEEYRDYVDEDYLAGIEWVQQNPKAVKNHHIRNVSVELLEKVYFADQNPAYYVPSWHFGYRPIQRYWHMQELYNSSNATTIVTGHCKPLMYKDYDGTWYTWMGCANDEYMTYNHEVSFYGDGYIPELAVLQCYASAEFFDTYCPNVVGAVSIHFIPENLRNLYHQSLARVPALTESLAIGTIQSKSNSLNLKNLRSIEETIAIGRRDIVEAWDKHRQTLIDDLQHMPAGFDLFPTKTALDNYTNDIMCPQRVNRIGALFRLDEEGLTEVHDHSIFQTGPATKN